MLRVPAVALLFLSAACGSVSGQTFNAGSDGSYGPLDIATDTTLDVAGNGVFHCTTINIAAGVTLSFNPNPLNTPVYLLATSDVTIAGRIDISGRAGNSTDGGPAGPGGFPGGKPGSGLAVPPGAGYGPGAGKGGELNASASGAGAGGYGTLPPFGTSINNGRTYGSPLLIPLVGGSGGGGGSGAPGKGGGGGGGAILIASNTRIDLTGNIRAVGGGDPFFDVADNGGSGGAIRLVAPVIAGNGELVALGNVTGGGGRIRLDTLNRSALNLISSPSASIGSLMMVFPNPVPRLDILEAAGTSIPEGHPSPVVVILPPGSPPTQTVRIQARHFSNLVPVAVVLTPDSGSPTAYEAQIDNRANEPAQITVNVVFPVNVQTVVNVWTR
ncbi:MAG: hypothetical protein HYY24_11510 [Verrucomicrobia bacterium]|nr:hypothetical protein [Verrucomicrobiota bacterium]